MNPLERRWQDAASLLPRTISHALSENPEQRPIQLVLIHHATVLPYAAICGKCVRVVVSLED
jgi:hypothetical protein